MDIGNSIFCLKYGLPAIGDFFHFIWLQDGWPEMLWLGKSFF